MILTCLLLDDEPLALKQMQGYVERTPFLSLAGTASTAAEAEIKIYETKPDLLFADINMPGVNGLDFVKSLKDSPPVIFTTAYSEYAIDGFRVNAIDYLLKPISYTDFLKAADKAKQYCELRKNTGNSMTSKDDACLFVKSEYRLVRIKYVDITYIEGMREYVRIHLSDGKNVMTLLSMKSLEERLTGHNFMRVHRSYIVNLDKITIVERQRIVFGKDCYIPIGEHYKETFEQYVNKNFL